MKKLYFLIGVIGSIISFNAMSDDLKLACTGTLYYPSINLKKPYDFTFDINLASKKFNLNIENSGYPSGDLVSNETKTLGDKCPNQNWNVQITETKIQISNNCGGSFVQDPVRSWEINRTDGKFHFYEFRAESATGVCIKSADRAF